MPGLALDVLLLDQVKWIWTTVATVAPTFAAFLLVLATGCFAAKAAGWPLGRLRRGDGPEGARRVSGAPADARARARSPAGRRRVL